MKKWFQMTTNILTGSLAAFAIAAVIFTVFNLLAVDRNDRQLFGYRFYIVQSDSMSLSENNADMDIYFNAGDVIITKTAVDTTALQPGDVITFLSTGTNSYGRIITHMIRQRQLDENGQLLGYETYGTNTGVSDEKLVEPTYILGQYCGKIPTLGNVFAFMQSTTGYIVCILLPFSALIGVEILRMIKLLRQSRAQQQKQVQMERDRLEEQIETLKAQLEQNEKTVAEP